MRRSWIVNPNPPHNLIPKDEYVPERERGLTIMPDLPDFVSPIDGKVVKGRKGYREHCRQHGVTNPADYKETWAKAAQERKQITKRDRPARIEAIKRAIEAQRNG
jgi:hypothetical protein